MNCPLVRSSCKYFSRGIDGLETVQTIKSRLREFFFAHPSSSVAMKPVAPIFIASSFLEFVLEMATTSSQPSAFAQRRPKWPSPPTPTIPTRFPGPAPFLTSGFQTFHSVSMKAQISKTKLVKRNWRAHGSKVLLTVHCHKVDKERVTLTVTPPHSIGAASAVGISSGILTAK